MPNVRFILSDYRGRSANTIFSKEEGDDDEKKAKDTSLYFLNKEEDNIVYIILI